MEQEVKEYFELRIPSKFGYEKIAADCVIAIAKQTNCLSSKIDDLRTAVIEACINSIEHGNKMDQNVHVTFGIFLSKEAIVIRVEDYGSDSIEDIYTPPDISIKISGRERPRGWGFFLIKNLMDKVEIRPITGGKKRLEMTLFLQSSQ